MAGRKLQEVYGQKPQVCITYPVLVGTDGVQRMSKSTGNYIGVSEPPEQIYGKTMSIPDGIMMQYFELLTDIPADELAQIKKQFDGGSNPMELKKRLAREIVTDLYSEKDADEAEKHFQRALYLSPRHHDALIQMMLIAERRGDEQAAGNYRRRAAQVARTGE